MNFYRSVFYPLFQVTKLVAKGGEVALEGHSRRRRPFRGLYLLKSSCCTGLESSSESIVTGIESNLFHISSNFMVTQFNHKALLTSRHRMKNSSHCPGPQDGLVILPYGISTHGVLFLRGRPWSQDRSWLFWAVRTLVASQRKCSTGPSLPPKRQVLLSKG